ncbi:MAG TPA: glycosyltransferase family 2 protein [Thermoleophilaceae bacterium]|nr:glycosyltransferase family 2 protein [Thermoleophilaceae bacterium]
MAALAAAPPFHDSALEGLDAPARAIIILSHHHGVDDDELATILDSTPSEVARRREDAMARVVALDAVSPRTATALEPPDASTVAPPRDGPTVLDGLLRVMAGAYLALLLAAVLLYKAAFLEMLLVDPVLTAYGLVVCAYIISRFGLSLIYRSALDRGLEPAVAVVMPAFNEEAAIAGSLRSLLALDYPRDKLKIVAVDDGSTDRTLAEMRAVAAADPRMRVIAFPENRGKRAAMAAGIRTTGAEIVAFVDSDSELEPDALRQLVQGFADPKVGAVCGHADVLNVGESWLTRMQAVRYYAAFRVVKAAESVFGTVTCCSGCFSAYRREAIEPRLGWWEQQRFLGRQSTFGDDRSLTNCVMRDWKTRYEAKAVSHTIVPAGFSKFMRQQLRWKRSWTRESLIVSGFVWRRNPAASLAVYVGIALPLVAPVVAVRAVLWQPLIGAGGPPVIYLVGVYAMALAYGLYYAVRHDRYDPLWIFGVVFCFFYLVFLLWQTYYAMATARASGWGTRPTTAIPAPAGNSP